ncbi:prepilin-type N-terminal cleavage/methylation domain-containing protein [Clostridium thermarum]|uniref:prepilin-type N-terminal cleavage/methylation domain-containing protein n=1 Tax=Clostridium thermarum TaxID=1716543 RepID=UPI0013D7CF5B|nr:prepilin-type N-terminal cleavage/methylation domain-containing protein [Clostridium thermarum]
MKKKKGLTLIELIIVLALTPMILALIYNVVLSGFKMINVEMKRANVYEQAKTYVTTLSYNLKNCRIYLDCDEISSTDLSMVVPSDAKPIVYIEGYDDKRYMYVLELGSDGRYDLKLYNFKNGVVQNKYKPIIEDGNYDEEFLDDDVYAKLAADLKNQIPSNADSLVESLKTGYREQFIYYDGFENNSYLIAEKEGDNYCKIALEKIVSYDTEVSSKTTIMEYIEDAAVKRNPVNEKLCSVMVKAIDEGKVKEISTDVYVFVQS